MPFETHLKCDDAELQHDMKVIGAATPGPWRFVYADDDVAMNGILVVTDQAKEELADHENNVALVLLQTPLFASVQDRRWAENAEFIARARTRWPEAIERIHHLEQRVAELERQLADAKRK